MNIIVQIKPLSVNQAFQGRKFKTKAYKAFEKEMLLLLPNLKKPITTPIKISLVFGFSNKLSDIDNPIKMVLDILQKKYKFNDRDIYELNIKKEITKKGDEFIKIDFFN